MASSWAVRRCALDLGWKGASTVRSASMTGIRQKWERTSRDPRRVMGRAETPSRPPSSPELLLLPPPSPSRISFPLPFRSPRRPPMSGDGAWCDDDPWANVGGFRSGGLETRAAAAAAIFAGEMSILLPLPGGVAAKAGARAVKAAPGHCSGVCGRRMDDAEDDEAEIECEEAGGKELAPPDVDPPVAAPCRDEGKELE